MHDVYARDHVKSDPRVRALHIGLCIRPGLQQQSEHLMSLIPGGQLFCGCFRFAAAYTWGQTLGPVRTAMQSGLLMHTLHIVSV